jgi:hypothetical protein
MFVLQNCTVRLTAEHGLCNQTTVQSADGSNAVRVITTGEEQIRIKEEEQPIALLSSIKDEPEVSPQTFHQYIGLLSVIFPFCLPAFTHKSAHSVNGNGLYIFRESVKCEG